MTQAASQEIATFRDPAGSLRIRGDQVRRTVNPGYADDLLRFLNSSLARNFTGQGSMVESQVLSAEADQPLQLEHPHIFFPSYPWEWSPSQWVAAAELTLDLCCQLLREGWVLKDATPLNILFEGPRPVLVDVLSIERRDPGNPLWTAYGQFARTFLLPLAANKYLGWPLAATINRRDGYEPADLYPYFSSWRRWTSPLRSLITVPYLLESRGKGTSSRPHTLRQSPEIATEVLGGNLRSFARTLRKLAPNARDSRWTAYQVAADHYTGDERQQKQAFVERAMEKLRPAAVLDIGANTGHYSRIAARAGALVVAWDTDVPSSDANWNEARKAGLPILPLVADAARPTPAVGWRNAESLTLLERARGRFDCVFMLGILHHLLLADQILMADLAGLLASISKRFALVEWVPKSDPRFIDLCRGRDEIYQHVEEGFFLDQFTRYFSVSAHERLSNGRTLYLLEKR
jgi:SAM-dependent methyltransferase